MSEKFTSGKWKSSYSSGNIYSANLKYPVALVMGRETNSNMSPEEYEANLRLLAHSKDLYFALLKARFFVPRNSQNRTEIEDLLCEINPDFDKCPEVTDIKAFAERVKNMRDWQKEHSQNPNSDTERYSESNEDLVDSIVAEILQEAQS